MTYRHRNEATFEIFPVNGSQYVVDRYQDYIDSTNSPRVNGKIRFTQNRLNHFRYHFRSQLKPIKHGSDTTLFNTYAFANDVGTVEGARMMDRLQDEAASRFYEMLANASTSLPQIFAERGQTFNMLASSMKRLSDWYRSFRRGRNPFTGRSCNGNNAADLWLEYTYGWVPTVSDVYGLMDLKNLTPPSPLLKVKKDGYLKKDLYTTHKLHPWEGTTLEYRREYVVNGRVTIRAIVEVSDPSIAFANSLGLLNPAALAWELLPYSFVVDWFLPIGTWLNNQTALWGLSLTQQSTTKTQRVVGSYQPRSYGPNIAAVEQNDPWFEIYKDRTLTIPSVPLPRLKNPFSPSHAISALALLKQTFK